VRPIPHRHKILTCWEMSHKGSDLDMFFGEVREETTLESMDGSEDSIKIDIRGII